MHGLWSQGLGLGFVALSKICVLRFSQLYNGCNHSRVS